MMKNAPPSTIIHFPLIASLNVKVITPKAPRTFVLFVPSRVARTSVEAPKIAATADKM